MDDILILCIFIMVGIAIWLGFGGLIYCGIAQISDNPIFKITIFCFPIGLLFLLCSVIKKWIDEVTEYYESRR